MKIVVNARLMQANRRDGIGIFSYHVLSTWITACKGIEFYVLISREEDAELIQGEHVHPVVLLPTPRHPILNFIWLEFSVRNFLKRIQPDLYIGLDGMLVQGWNGKQLSVIHDINFYHHPDFVKRSDRLFYRYFFPRYAKQALRIATVSEFSKKDIAKSFQVHQEKIDVVYNGIPFYLTPLSAEEMKAARQFYTEGHPYFYFVGSLSPRKNLVRMLQAFDQFASNTQEVFYLVISGADLYRTNEIYTAHNKMRFKNRVVFTGAVPDEIMHTLMASSLALLFIPLFEGFGIPLIEAMQCEVPVIASNVSSVPEVVGDAALLVDPYNVESIAEAMQAIATQPSIRLELIAQGNIRKMNFSWEKTADLLWKSVEKALSAP